MLIKEILEILDLNIELPSNILNEDLGNVRPKEYAKRDNTYIIRFYDSTLNLKINLDNDEEYFVMTEKFKDIRDFYVSYNIDGELYCIS